LLTDQGSVTIHYTLQRMSTFLERNPHTLVSLPSGWVFGTQSFLSPVTELLFGKVQNLDFQRMHKEVQSKAVNNFFGLRVMSGRSVS
jgi:hypothetical protein